MSRSDLLLVNIGRGNPTLPPPGYVSTTYLFPGGAEHTTSLAGLALWRWLAETGREPKSVLVACTEAAWEDKAAVVTEEAQRLGLDVGRLATPVHLELPRTLDDVWAVLPPLERWIDAHLNGQHAPVVHVDVTHAYRAIPIAHTWMLLYLQRSEKAAVGVVGYGAYDPESPDRTPFLDLSHLMRMADWAAAARDLAKAGDARELGRLVEEEEELRRGERVADGGLPREAAASFSALRRVARAATATGRFFPAGLPLELGIETAQALGQLTPDEAAQAARAVVPGVESAARRLCEEARGFAMSGQLARKDPKRSLVLDAAEIERQLRLVEVWLGRNAVGQAARALREAVVNRLLLEWGAAPGEWLERSCRERAEGALNELRPSHEAELALGSHPTTETSALGRIWDALCRARNSFAHAAMQPDKVNVDEDGNRVFRLLDELRELCEKPRAWPKDPGRHGHSASEVTE